MLFNPFILPDFRTFFNGMQAGNQPATGIPGRGQGSGKMNIPNSRLVNPGNGFLHMGMLIMNPVPPECESCRDYFYFVHIHKHIKPVTGYG
jgi:hypothetical protein